MNDRSGTVGKSAVTRLGELFAKHGITPQFLEPEQGISITEIAQRAIRERYDVIIAAGGDGTVNAVASTLVGSGKSLGIIAMGTLNHFARDLGIPTGIEAAVAIIAAGRVKAVDVGDVNGRIFVNNSGLGLYPAVVRMRETLQRSGYRKWPAFIWASLVMFARFRRLRLDLHPVAGSALQRTTPVLFIGNNTYDTGWTELGTRAALDRGRLWVMMSTATTRLGLLASAFAILGGREQAADVTTFEVVDLIVSSRRRYVTVAADGEVFQLRSPLNYRILPTALRVIVPGNGPPHAK